MIKNRAFFFAAFEGYRETFGVTLNGHGADAATARPDPGGAADPGNEDRARRDPAAQRSRSTRTSAATVIARPRTRSDNTFLGKTDVVVHGGNLSVDRSAGCGPKP